MSSEVTQRLHVVNAWAIWTPHSMELIRHHVKQISFRWRSLRILLRSLSQVSSAPSRRGWTFSLHVTGRSDGPVSRSSSQERALLTSLNATCNSNVILEGESGFPAEAIALMRIAHLLWQQEVQESRADQVIRVIAFRPGGGSRAVQGAKVKINEQTSNISKVRSGSLT